MSRHETSFFPAAKEAPKEQPPQDAKAPEAPKPAPIITDYASL